MRSSNIISLLALFFALSGIAYAATLADNSVLSRHVAFSTLQGVDVKNGSLTGFDIKDGSLDARDVLGGLPGITYFRFNEKNFTFNSAETVPIITDKVAKGEYFVEAQVIADGKKAQSGDLLCRIRYGSGKNPADAAYGFDTRTFPSTTLGGTTPSTSLTLSGVFTAKEDNTPVWLSCAGLNLVHNNSRLTSIELRDLQIDYEE